MNKDFNLKFGELCIMERKLLYNWIRVTKPQRVVEIGTGKGGSSYCILEGLVANKCGVLYSCDPKRKPTDPTFGRFSRIFKYFRLTSKQLIDHLIDKNITPDFLFFDGPEIPEVALEDFKRLDEIVQVGTIFIMHDWCIEERKLDKGVSVKAKLLKPYLYSNKKWEILLELDGLNYEEGQETVGMVFAKKIKL